MLPIKHAIDGSGQNRDPFEKPETYLEHLKNRI